MGWDEMGAWRVQSPSGRVDQVMIRTSTPAIVALVADVEAIVRRGRSAIDTARIVAGALGKILNRADLLADEHREADDARYRQHILHVDPEGEFSIVALVWRPGQRTPIHDHVSWCVVGVYAGSEEETLYRLAAGDDAVGGVAYLVPAGHVVNAEGTTGYFVPPGDIHEVRNPTDRTVISIHIYGADVSVLGGSVRRRYDLPVRAA